MEGNVHSALIAPRRASSGGTESSMRSSYVAVERRCPGRSGRDRRPRGPRVCPSLDASVKPRTRRRLTPPSRLPKIATHDAPRTLPSHGCPTLLTVSRPPKVRARIEGRQEPPFDRLYDPLIFDLVRGGELARAR